MALTTCKVVWLKALLNDLGLKSHGPVALKCDNQEAIFIAANLVFHVRMKHIDIDQYFVREKMQEGVIAPSCVKSVDQVADIFTKILPTSQHYKLLHKMGVIESYSHVEGECKGKKIVDSIFFLLYTIALFSYSAVVNTELYISSAVRT